MKVIPGLRAMFISVVIRLGGWHPCPDPPYLSGHRSSNVVAEVQTLPV